MKGEVVYLYAFDVANEILTSRVQEILSRKPAPFTIRADRSLPRSVPLYRPLTIEPPPPTARLHGRPVRLLVRVYDVGVVSVGIRVPVEVDSLARLTPFHNAALEDGRPLDAVARELCEQVCESIKDCMVRGAPTPEPEAYTVFCLTDLGGAVDANGWLAEQRRPVAGLLTETGPDELSEAQVAEVLRLQRSFAKTDVVVIDWDAALVVDLTGYVDDVLYVLELANLQLEEFLVMDRTLDRYLDGAYVDLERRPASLFGVSSPVLAKLRRFRVDLTRLADEVTHISKFFGDWHLARVYLAARERFYLDAWRSSVEQRLAQLDQLYSVVQSELNERRMLWLEVVIVVLFVIDVVALLFFPKA